MFIEGFEVEVLFYCVKLFLGVFIYMYIFFFVICGLEWGEFLLDVCNNNRINFIFDYNFCFIKVVFLGKGLCIFVLNDIFLNIK